MSGSIDPALIARARADFLDGLPARIGRIHELLVILLSTDGWNENNAQHLHRLVHNLVGTAGTFGVQRLAEVARVLEMALDTVIKNGQVPNELEHNSILSAMHWLENTIKDVISGDVGYVSHVAAEQSKRSHSLIYLVEDDLDVAWQIQQHLEFDGYHVRHFDCAATFIDAVKQGQEMPAAVIMDMVLPEGDEAGADAIREVRACCLISTPVVFLSARADIQARLSAYRAGATRYLVKPQAPESLAKTLDDLLYRSELNACRVLLVDDDADMLLLHSAMLAEADLQVMTESDPLQTIEFIDRYKPDVLVLDVHMPEVSGPEIAAILREDDKYASLPIIFLSAEPNVTRQMLALDQGADDFLLKPVQPERLVQMVKTRARRARWVRQLIESYDRLNYERERQQVALDEHAIVSIADARGIITYVNDRFCRISGFKRNELIGQNHRIVKSGEHPTDFYQQMWQTISQGKVWHGTLCNRKKTGELYWVESTIVPFADEAGKPYQYVSIRTDVTELKRNAEVMTLQSQAMENSQNAILIVSATLPDMPLIYVNPAFEKMTGYSRAEALGQNCRFLQGEDRSQSVLDGLRGSLQDSAPRQILLRNYRKDGEMFWNQLSISPVQNDSGEVTHFIGIIEDVTARELAQKQLKDHEGRLRRSQQYANIGTWDWNIETGELYWSERIAPLFGYEPGTLETTYDNFLRAVHPDDRQMVIDAVNACVEHGAVYDIEHRCVWPDGSIRWMLERGDVERDSEGKPLHMLGVVQDITRRKEAELAQGKSRRQLVEAQRLARLGSWEANMQTGELTWSDMIYEIIGRDKNTFVPSVEAFHSTVHPDDRSLVDASEHRALESGKYDVVHRIILPEGQIRVVHELGHASFDENGNITHLYGTVQDITELVRTKQDMELFRSVIAVSEQGVAITNANGELIFLNHAAETLLACNFADVQGRHFREFIAPSEADAIEQNIIDALVAGKPGWRGKIPVINRQGEEFIIHSNIGYLRDEQGKVENLFNVFFDYTSELARQRELEQAKTQAERANQAKSEFLSSMSHELRTPMNAILGFAQLLQFDEDMTPLQKENLNEIRKAGDHLLGLINEVLDLSKIEAGHIDLSLERISLLDLVEECTALVAPVASQKSILLRQESMPAVFVQADNTRLKQALLNLLTNAIKYNRPDGVVTLVAAVVDEKFVRIKVIDTGMGISAKRLGELFQPFNRLGAEDSEIEGTGIGLAITRKLIELMGGKVGAESNEGVGSTFWFDIPLAEGPVCTAGAEQLSNAHEFRPRYESERGVMHTILCVEDNPANLQLISRILERSHNINLLMAHEPSLGVQLAATHHPDLILLDINLPGMNGFEILEVLRSDTRLSKTPIIAVSANAMQRDIEKARQAGFDAYLTKPLDVQLFLNTINQFLDSSRK